MNAATVKAAVRPMDFYRAELPDMPAPKRGNGWASGGLCPFHADTHTGNFRVNLDTGGFSCFACGAKGGDVVTFTQLRHGLSFGDALQSIADAWGVRT